MPFAKRAPRRRGGRERKPCVRAVTAEARLTRKGSKDVRLSKGRGAGSGAVTERSRAPTWAVTRVTETVPGGGGALSSTQMLAFFFFDEMGPSCIYSYQTLSWNMRAFYSSPHQMSEESAPSRKASSGVHGKGLACSALRSPRGARSNGASCADVTRSNNMQADVMQ